MDGTVRRFFPFIRSGRASGRLRTAPAVLGSALLAFAAGGCEPGGPSDAAIRSDSAGIALVEYPRLPPIEESRIAIAAEPDLVLGGGGAVEGPDYEFFQITGVSQLRDGTLVVANGGTRELRFYGADGRFLRSVGASGDGPGEFRGVSLLGIGDDDTVVTWDGALRRLQHFRPDGTFVRSTSVVTAPFIDGQTAQRPPQPQAIIGGRRVVVFIESPTTPTEGPERRPLLVALHQIDDGGWDSVRVVPGREQIVEVLGSSLGFPGYAFPAYPVAAGAGASMAVADGAHFRVERFDLDGRLVSVISASVPEVPVTSDVIEGYIEHMIAHAPGLVTSAAELEEYEERLRRQVPTSHAPFLPAIRDLFVDADERIWVERYDVPARDPSRWEVFARDGTWVGRVEMPEGFARGRSPGTEPGFSIASGRLAGVWPDPDTGVETIRVYRVVEPDS